MEHVAAKKTTFFPRLHAFLLAFGKMLGLADALIARSRHSAVSYSKQGQELKLNVIKLHQGEASLLRSSYPATESNNAPSQQVWTHKNHSYYLVCLPSTSESVLVPSIALHMVFGSDDSATCQAWLATAPAVTPCKNSICLFCYPRPGAANRTSNNVIINHVNSAYIPDNVLSTTSIDENDGEQKSSTFSDPSTLCDTPMYLEDHEKKTQERLPCENNTKDESDISMFFADGKDVDFFCGEQLLTDNPRIVVCPSCNVTYDDGHLPGCLLSAEH